MINGDEEMVSKLYDSAHQYRIVVCLATIVTLIIKILCLSLVV